MEYGLFPTLPPTAPTLPPGPFSFPPPSWPASSVVEGSIWDEAQLLGRVEERAEQSCELQEAPQMWYEPPLLGQSEKQLQNEFVGIYEEVSQGQVLMSLEQEREERRGYVDVFEGGQHAECAATAWVGWRTPDTIMATAAGITTSAAFASPPFTPFSLPGIWAFPPEIFFPGSGQPQLGLPPIQQPLYGDQPIYGENPVLEPPTQTTLDARQPFSGRRAALGWFVTR